MRIECPAGQRFHDPSFQDESVIIAVCGPNQYRFTITSENGRFIADSVSNFRFGCGGKNVESW